MKGMMRRSGMSSLSFVCRLNTFLGEADRKQRIRIQRTTLESLGQKQQRRSEDRWNGQHVLKLKLLSLSQWQRKKIPAQRLKGRKIIARPSVDLRARVQRIGKRGKRPSKLNDRYVFPL
jgi:hypothetical protein